MRYFLFILLFGLFFNLTDSFAQCRSFAKEVCKPRLENFVHDGNLNGIILSQGEEVELHKAFFSEQKYRMLVCREDHLPPVHFRIVTSDYKVLFDSKDTGYKELYDFELEESATLIISFKFLETEESKKSKVKLSGCVSLLFGVKL